MGASVPGTTGTPRQRRGRGKGNIREKCFTLNALNAVLYSNAFYINLEGFIDHISCEATIEKTASNYFHTAFESHKVTFCFTAEGSCCFSLFLAVADGTS